MSDQSGNGALFRRTASLRIMFFTPTPSVSCLIEGIDADLNSVELWCSNPLPLNLTTTSLAGKIDQLKMILTPSHTLIWNGLSDPLAKPEGHLVEEFEDCMNRVISDGAGLYSELRELGMGEVLDKIEELLQEGDKVKIKTDAAFFPWEILYPFDYNKERAALLADEPAPDRFALWGYRFIIEYSLAATNAEGGWSSPYREHNGGAAYVSLNINKSIESSFTGRPFKPIEHHRSFYDCCIGEDEGQWCDEGPAILTNLLSRENKATLIYLYCHGSSDSPIAPAGDRKEVLELDGNIKIDPATLDGKNPPPFLRGPVIILNSCNSAAQSPLSFSSFHRKFRKRRAMGIVGTTIQMPATFAAAVGRRLMEDYLRGIPLGKALFSLRQQLIKRHNPLALFYSLQCPSHITAPKG